MPLTNSQYHAILRKYDQLQFDDLRRQAIRRAEVYEAFPQIQAIDEEIAGIYAQQARQAVWAKSSAKTPAGSPDPQASLAKLTRQKEELLVSHGYPADYLELSYHCPDCQDTGYIGSKKCHCFRQAAADLICGKSSLRERVRTENFQTFSLNYYSDKKESGPGFSPRDSARAALRIAKNFVSAFPTWADHDQDKAAGAQAPVSRAAQTSSQASGLPVWDPHLLVQDPHLPVQDPQATDLDNPDSVKTSVSCQNLLICGNTGVGKTFLATCIAGELLNQGYTVLYLTAFELVEIFKTHTFGSKEEEAALEDGFRYVLDSDLLIIDDLGTEMNNLLVTSQLFLCINERLLQNRSTIISTNMAIEDLQREYSERISSRIISRYTEVYLFGEDIRVRKAISEM